MGCTTSKPPLFPSNQVILSSDAKADDERSNDETDQSKALSDAYEMPINEIKDGIKEDVTSRKDQSDQKWPGTKGSPLKSLMQQPELSDEQREEELAPFMSRDVVYSMRSNSDQIATRNGVDGVDHFTGARWKRDEGQDVAQMASRPARVLMTDPLEQPQVDRLRNGEPSPQMRACEAPLLANYRDLQIAVIPDYRESPSFSIESRILMRGLGPGNPSEDRQQSLPPLLDKNTDIDHAIISSKSGKYVEDDFGVGKEVEEWGLEACIEFPTPGLKLKGLAEVKHEKVSQLQLSSTNTLGPTTPDDRSFGLQAKFRPALHVSDNIEKEMYDSKSEGSDEDDGEECSDTLHDWLASPRDVPATPSVASSSVSPTKSEAPLGSARESFQANILAHPLVAHRHSRHLYGLTILPSDLTLHLNGNSPTSPHSHRQSPTSCLGTGTVSPTKRGLFMIGTPSPEKQSLYRSGIVKNFAPPLVPRVMASERSPSRAKLSPSPSPTVAVIRDTSVVKKKKAELPHHNLPHPVPKFGDWLNSRTMINNYIILESLGVGGYAEVKLCKEKQSGKLFAMKFINRDVMKKDKLGKQSKFDDIKREIAIMKKLNHPHVLRLYEVLDDPKMNKLFLVLEYMQHGDMLSFQKKKHPQKMLANLRDRDLHCILLQVILGLAYLHEQKIVHGDIKPQNLLVGDRDVVKIADFGISQSLYGSKQKLMDVAGTPAFMSPEMCSGQEYSGQLADVWALGATVFMLKFGHPPFVAKSAMVMFERIQNDPLVFPGPIDPVLAHLLHGMLTKVPSQRLTLLDVMIHPWVTKNEKLSLALDANYHPSRPMTVSSDEIEHAVGANHIGIILNIHKQMFQQLEHARASLAEKKKAGAFDSHAGHSPKAVNAKNVTRMNRVFAASSDEKSGCVVAEERNVLSSEETAYRSQLFSRKKASKKNALELTHTGGNYSGVGSLADPSYHSRNDSIDDDDVVSDEDELAVSQSPQLLDELLLTTLSMPPLANNPPPLFVTRNDTGTKGAISSALSTQKVVDSRGSSDGHRFYGDSPALAVSYGVSSLEGRRHTQEDRWVVFPSLATVVGGCDGNPPLWATQTAYVGLYDGHGGEECATILHEQLHTWMFKAHDGPLQSAKAFQDCFKALDVSVCDYLVQKDDLSGSTATALVLCPAANGNTRLTIAHVGDCRLVLGKCDGSTVELTQDHRLTVDAERERIVQLGGRVVNNRVNGVMAITRAFGDVEFKGLLTSRQGTSTENVPSLLTATPDVIDLELNRRDDAFLLLACDGLWDVLTSEEATAMFRERLHLHGDIQLAAQELAQEGIRRYSNDNITVIAIDLQCNISA